MIYSAKIRRMSRRRRKVAVRRRMREIVRDNLRPFIGRRADRETLAQIRAAVSVSMLLLSYDVARLQVLAQEAIRARSNPPA